MKLEKQVCTPEQAKRLWEMGVIQRSYYTWGCNDEFDNLPPTTWTLISGPEWKHVKYSAFTIPELAVMIGKGTNAAALLYDAVQDQMNRSHSFTVVLDPRFVAQCVIGMLETDRITAEEINNRLKAA
jgi:hypothetical protein